MTRSYDVHNPPLFFHCGYERNYGDANTNEYVVSGPVLLMKTSGSVSGISLDKHL